MSVKYSDNSSLLCSARLYCSLCSHGTFMEFICLIQATAITDDSHCHRPSALQVSTVTACPRPICVQWVPALPFLPAKESSPILTGKYSNYLPIIFEAGNSIWRWFSVGLEFSEKSSCNVSNWPQRQRRHGRG